VCAYTVAWSAPTEAAWPRRSCSEVLVSGFMHTVTAPCHCTCQQRGEQQVMGINAIRLIGHVGQSKLHPSSARQMECTHRITDGRYDLCEILFWQQAGRCAVATHHRLRVPSTSCGTEALGRGEQRATTGDIVRFINVQVHRKVSLHTRRTNIASRSCPVQISHRP
jgi:hypothetical protein